MTEDPNLQHRIECEVMDPVFYQTDLELHILTDQPIRDSASPRIGIKATYPRMIPGDTMNIATRYEIICETPEGQAVLAGYCRIKSKSAMLRMIRQPGQDWARIARCEKLQFSGRKGWASWIASLGNLRFRFSGRTQHEATACPKPWFKEVLV